MQHQYLSRDGLKDVWDKKPVTEIAAQFGVRVGVVYHWARKWGLPPRSKVDPLAQRPDDPSEAEIRQRAAEVRAQWSPAEKSRRRIGGTRKWTPPLIEVAEIEAPVYSRI